MYRHALRIPQSEFDGLAERQRRRRLQYSHRRPLTQARLAPAEKGLYRIFRQDRLIYAGQAGNLRRRLMEHLWCLTHLRIVPAPYQFNYALMPRSTSRTRRRAERVVIEAHRSKLPHQRELEILGEFDVMHYGAPPSGLTCNKGKPVTLLGSLVTLVPFRRSYRRFRRLVEPLVGRYTIYRSDGGRRVRKLIANSNLKTVHRRLLEKHKRGEPVKNPMLFIDFSYVGQKGNRRVCGVSFD